MKPQFTADVPLEVKLNTWIELTKKEIISLINEYNNYYSGSLFYKFEDLRQGFEQFITSIDERKRLIGPRIEFLLKIIESIYDATLAIHQKVAVVAPEHEFINQVNDISNYVINLPHDYVKSINYIIIDQLSINEFLILDKEINENGIKLKDFITFDLLENTKSYKKQIIIKNIIDLRNILNSKSGGENNYRIDGALSQIRSNIELIQLEENIEEIKDSSEILKQVKQNITQENNKNLITGYSLEASNLTVKIDDLNKLIVILFTTIIVAIALKTIFIFLCIDSFKNIYSFLTFISLILACSALITYLIKDRNRIIKLHDHYKMNVLELSTMPEYMRELDKGQRQQLIIDLSNNYFRGTNHNQETSNDKTSELEGLKATISDIAKMVSDIKETMKK